MILYLHGLGSKPGGIKPAFLRGQGFEVINPALPDEDFEESVRIAGEAYDQHHPDVVVGSAAVAVPWLWPSTRQIRRSFSSPQPGKSGGANPGTSTEGDWGVVRTALEPDRPTPQSTQPSRSATRPQPPQPSNTRPASAAHHG